MSKNKEKIKSELQERGFSGVFQLFYHANDGWYIWCDQLIHEFAGYNTPDVIRQIRKGVLDYHLSTTV